MSTGTLGEGRAKIAARTLRTDRWWLSPLLNAAALGSFLLYATVRLFWDRSYFVEDFHYVAPFYSRACPTAVSRARHRWARRSARCPLGRRRR